MKSNYQGPKKSCLKCDKKFVWIRKFLNHLKRCNPGQLKDEPREEEIAKGKNLFSSLMASKPIDIGWIRTGFKPYLKIMCRIVLYTRKTLFVILNVLFRSILQQWQLYM